MSVWTEFCLWGVSLLPNFVMLGGLHEKHEGKREFETKLSIRSMTEENHTET